MDDVFKPYASRGTAESLLYDVYLRHNTVLVDFGQEVSEARARHSFSEFKRTYYHLSDKRHVDASDVLVSRVKRLNLNFRMEEMLVWYSKDLEFDPSDD